MKLKPTFVVHSIADSQIMVPVGESADTFHGFLRNNETAAFIIDNLKDNTTKEELVIKLCSEYDVDVVKAQKAVDYVINQLSKMDALDY